MVSKKKLLIIGTLGLIIIIIGFFFNPAFVAKIVHQGKSFSAWRTFQAYIFQLFLLLGGSAIVLSAIVFALFLKEGRIKFYLLTTGLIGIIFTIIGIIADPTFYQSKSANIYYIPINILHSIYGWQLKLIILGFIIFVGVFFIFVYRFLIAKKTWSLILLPIILIIYFVLIYSNYFDKIYPKNILFKTNSYSKVFNLLIGRDILLSDFEPHSTLIVKRKYVKKAKYPVIDINFHLSSAYQTKKDRRVLDPKNLVESMDSVGVRIIVNTDGFRGNLERYSEQYPDRFINFFPTGFPRGVMSNKQIAELPNELENAVKRGAQGDGEIWKNLGAWTRDETGKVIPVDDPRLDPLWDKAGELGIPILWHMIDVPSNFLPINKYNERFVMLSKYPEFSFYAPGVPSRDTMIKDREKVLMKHPETTFIGCHMGMNANNLDYCAYLLDTFPNYYLDLSTVLSELGRQPYTARKFFIKYQNRILFGTDGGSLFNVKGWTVEKFYQAYFDFLETDDEYIKYPMQGAIDQGDWRIYGINLPDTVLEKIYYKNAAKILHLKIQ